MKLRALLIIGVMCIVSHHMQAQDIHFSQYYAAPLTLNPALTGKFNGLYRVTAIYRDQYRNINRGAVMYMTPSGSVDFSLFKDALKTDALGLGLVAVFDKTGAIQTTKAGLSLAYHKGLDKAGKYHFSLGFQGMYINRSLNDDLRFGHEIPGHVDFDPGAQEVLQEDDDHLFDFNTGALFDAQFTDWMTFYAGYSWFHLPKPEDDFVNNTGGETESELGWRHVAHGGFEFLINNKVYIIPGFLFQTMTKAVEVNLGSTFGYQFSKSSNKELALFLGTWYRLDNAVIVKGGVEFQQFRLSGAYDIGLGGFASDVNDAKGKLPSSFEISLSYIGVGKPLQTDRYLFNPRF